MKDSSLITYIDLKALWFEFENQNNTFFLHFVVNKKETKEELLQPEYKYIYNKFYRISSIHEHFKRVSILNVFETTKNNSEAKYWIFKYKLLKSKPKNFKVKCILAKYSIYRVEN